MLFISLTVSIHAVPSLTTLLQIYRVGFCLLAVSCFCSMLRNFLIICDLDCGGLPLALHHLLVLVSKIYFDEYKKTLALGTVKSVGNYMSASNLGATFGAHNY